jgi:predicted aspartyl protease
VVVLCLGIAGCGAKQDELIYFHEGTLSPTDHQSCRLDKVADLPYQLVSGHLIVDVKIGGQPARLLFDTGAVTTIMTSAAAQRLTLVREIGPKPLLQKIEGVYTAAPYSAHTLEFGLLHGAKWRMAVADTDFSEFKVPPDGLLGVDALWTYDIDLDVPANRVILYYPEHDCSNPSVYMHGDLYRVPLIAPTRQTPRIHVWVDGKDLVAGLDTGAPTSALFSSGLRKLGVAKSRNGEAGKQKNDAKTTAAPSAHRRIATITIGDIVISGFAIDIIDNGQDWGEDMLIGLDAMRRVHMWVSRSSGTLVMQFPPEPSPDAEGGTGSATGPDSRLK